MWHKHCPSRRMKVSTCLRVLYAENDDDELFMIRTLFEFSNIEVLPAKTVADTLNLANSEHFDLYLLDTRFPDGHGLELCRQLRERSPQTPIVFYSGDAFKTDKQKGMEAGASAYLTKPSIDDLTVTINYLIKLNN